MALTAPTPADVRTVIDVSAVADDVLQSFIDDALTIVARCPAVADSDATTQRSILKWITAHFLSLRYGKSGLVVSESIGDAAKSYAAPRVAESGKGFGSTFYGQQAILLDPTGCLEKLGKLRPVFVVM